MTTPAPQGATPPPAPQGATPPEPQGEGTPQNPTPPADGAPPAPEPQGTDWQAEARKWEQRAKKDKEALDSLKKSVQTVLTPEQAEATKRTAEQAEQERDQARQEALRLRVALRSGLPETWADRLRGATEDELVADAKELAKFIQAGEQTPPAKPGVPDAGAATGRRPKPEAPDLNSLLRTMAGR